MAAGSHSTSAVSAIALTAVHVAAIDSSNATVDLGRVRKASSQTQDCVVHNIMRLCFRAGIN
jgi:hypothetical protein